VIVLHALEDAQLIQQPDVRAIAGSRLEHLAAEDLLGGDTPSAVIVMEVSDKSADLGEQLGFDVLETRYSGCRFDQEGYVPSFEVLEEHPSLFEIVFVLSDYGDGAVVLVPKLDGVDADLLAMCAMYAVPSPEPSP
jgi:hypothetical protein